MSKTKTTPDHPSRVQSVGQFCLFETKHALAEIDFAEKSIKRLYHPARSEAFLEPVPRQAAAAKEFSIPLSVGGLNNFRLPLGLTVVSGATAAGKSTFLRALQAGGLRRLIAVEPPDTDEEVEDTPIYSSVDAALCSAILATVETGQPHAIDSLREPLFEINGPAGDKGIIMPFFTAVTRVSNSLAMNRLSLMASINPMSTDSTVVAAFLSKLSASVPCYIDLKEIGSAGYSGTIFTRQRRSGATFTLPLKPSSVVGRDVAFSTRGYNYDREIYSHKQVRTLEQEI